MRTVSEKYREYTKSETGISFRVAFLNGNYHFLSHAAKLITVGFKTKEKLMEYEPDIRFDACTVNLMAERYTSIIG